MLFLILCFLLFVNGIMETAYSHGKLRVQVPTLATMHCSGLCKTLLQFLLGSIRHHITASSCFCGGNISREFFCVCLFVCFCLPLQNLFCSLHNGIFLLDCSTAHKLYHTIHSMLFSFTRALVVSTFLSMCSICPHTDQ